MNKIFVIIGIKLLISTASAGVPDQSSMLKDLRQRFLNGRQPSSAELLGKTFQCRNFSFSYGQPTGYTQDLNFSSFGNFLQEHDSQHSIGKDQFFTQKRKEYIAVFKPLNSPLRFTVAYRIDVNGYLIEEISSKLDGFDGVSHGAVIPIAEAPLGSSVLSYGLCVHP